MEFKNPKTGKQLLLMMLLLMHSYSKFC